TDRASREKRSRISSLSSRSSLMAIWRSSVGSQARYKAPIPPCAIRLTILKRPIVSGRRGAFTHVLDGNQVVNSNAYLTFTPFRPPENAARKGSVCQQSDALWVPKRQRAIKGKAK